jgi:serine/threonine protein kinase/tetratricopeptide (TPR) repeat protein
MSPKAQRVRDLFVAAVKLPPEQWQAFLEEACADDVELRHQVSDLLREYQQAGNFLDRPAAHVRATGDFEPAANGVAAAAEEGPGTIIGPYKLLEQVGEGGMGAVWMAEQREPMQRKVALKIIKAGMDSRQLVARFEAERQALALMDHANIAKVLDGGTTASGRPYFVMELVKGVPITRYCDEHRLTPRQRLELFLPVCLAIQHAHQKGIIHRDVKPANVLVAPYDGVPVPKVIDFGVAKATGQRLTERTLFTGLGAVVGTLEYMSPEQAELNNHDIDTRSDIYALGVLLYELLTGTTPLRRERLTRAAFTEMLRAIREEEPSRPSARLSESKEALPSIAAQRHMEPVRLTRLVRGELDWIVMKALDKDRNRRYETANGLAHDIERYLHDEPVQACPPSAGYRLRKLLRRNRGPVVAGGLVLLALVAGIIGTTLGLFQARAATEAERNAREAETAQRLRAEDNAKLAMAVLNDIILEEARQRLTLYDKEEVKGLARSPEREKLEREFLEKGLRFYERLAQTNAADWAARRARARAYANVGLLRLDLKNYLESEKAYSEAVRLMEELASEKPGDFDSAYDLAYTYHWLYRAYWDSGRIQPAEEITRHALALFEQLAADFPDRAPLAQEYQAYCHRNLGGALAKSAKPQEAEKAFRRALVIWTALAAANPKHPGYRNAVAYDRQKLGELYQQTGRLTQAGSAWREAQALCEKLAAEVPGEPTYLSHVAHLDWRLAGLLKEDGKPKEAEQAYRRALHRFEKLAADFPAVAFYWQEQAFTCFLLAGLLKETGQVQEVEKAYRQALPIHEKLVIDFPSQAEFRSRLWGNLGELAENLLQQGKHAEAAKVAEKFPGAMRKNATGYQSAARVLARCMALAAKDAKLSETDRKALAQAYAERSRELMREGLGVAPRPDAPELRDAVARSHHHLAQVLQEAGQAREAEKAFREALAIWDQLAKDHPDRREYRQHAAWTRGALAALLAVARRAPEAVEAYRQAVSAQEKLAADTNSQDHRWHLAGRAEILGTLLERAGQRREAENAYRKALAVWEKLVADFPTVADYRGHCGWCGLRLANLLEATGRHTEAQEVCRRVRVEWDKLVELAPNLIGFHAIAAWNWVTCPEPACRDVRRALEVLQACVQKAPAWGDSWNALGVAHYRAGDWKAAQAALVKGAALRRGGNSFDWFFLAMARWQLGKKDEAARWYRLALRWMDEHKPTPGVRFGDDQYHYEDLLRIRSEAAALLRLPELAPPEAQPGPIDVLGIANLLLEAGPSEALAYQNRGNAYADSGRWDKAVADYAKAVELAPDQAQTWYFYALTRLGAADTKGYRSSCASILERFGKTEAPDTAYWAAWTCVVGPDAVAPPDRLVPLAEKALAKAPTSYDYLTTSGVALYRAGRFEEAVKRLGEADTAYKRDARFRQPVAYSWIFLAMAHHRLGQTEEARKWLDKAVQWMDQAGLEKGQDAASKIPMPWNRRLTLRLLRNEAETLIQGATTTPPHH